MSIVVKSWLAAAGIFVVGVVTGGALSWGLSPHFSPPPGERAMKQHWMANLTSKLDLTPDQQTKIQQILTDAEKQIHALHHEEVTRLSAIIASAHKQIEPLLTPDQQVKLQQLETEREKQFSGHVHPWAPPPGSPDQGPHFPGDDRGPSPAGDQPPTPPPGA